VAGECVDRVRVRLGRTVVDGRTGPECRVGGATVDEPADEVDGVVAAVVAAGPDGSAAEEALVPDEAEHAASRATAAAAAALRSVRLTYPGWHGAQCHGVPMSIRGWVLGVSQRITVLRLSDGIDTHPAVAEPTETCRKKALPAPCRTGPAFRVL
jgi:hypothetical protein